MLFSVAKVGTYFGYGSGTADNTAVDGIYRASD
jgi:hypothetical protein